MVSQRYAIVSRGLRRRAWAICELGLFGPANKNLAKSDVGVREGKISIQRQRMFALGDALKGALRENADKSQHHVGDAHSSGDRRQGFDQLRFGRRERRAIGHDRIVPGIASMRADPDERIDIVGIGGERAIEKAARLRDVLGAHTLVEPSHALKIEVHRIRVRRSVPRAAPRRRPAAFSALGEARDDLVLHVEKIGDRLVEPLGPEMMPALGVDELHVDAHAVSAALDAALEHIANVQFAADLLHVEGLPL